MAHAWKDTINSDQRARELTAKMDLIEAASQIRYDAPAIPRLSIPDYNWWNESLHGVSRAGTSTVFPQAIGMAAIFDDQYIRKIGETVSMEARAKYNENQRNGDHGIYKGLTMWSPNINIFRDPRWGRGQETYGEDPFLTARTGVAYIQGLQGEGKYLRVAACAKHFAVHSGPEKGRHELNSEVSLKDLYETYLPAFEACVKEGGVETVMGAYNRVNGEPCCGSKTLLQDILRQKWGFRGHVVSDCGAIMDFHTNHKVTQTIEESAALAITNGCDLNCGSVYTSAVRAVEQGLLSEEHIRNACRRVMRTRFRLGMFDDDCEYDAIPYSVNDCPEHRKLAVDAARKSMVLLKNDGILPLDKKSLQSIAVIGPNANSRTVLEGNYCGTPSQYITALDGIMQEAGDDIRVYYSDGCHLCKDNENVIEGRANRIDEAVSITKESDVAIVCLGLDPHYEGEEGDPYNPYGSGDKMDLNLPGLQQELLEQVTAVGKPVIVVLFTGSPLAVNWAQDHCNAILNAWYPGGRGGKALADLLFGHCSPSGKLPVTFYRDLEGFPAIENYSMQGRTYRYYEKEPLYPFGYGLTYTTMTCSDLTLPQSGQPGQEVPVTVTVTNTGNFAADEVVQVYIKPHSEFAPPNPSLVGYARVSLAPGDSTTVQIVLAPSAFQVVDYNGERIYDSNSFEIFCGFSQPDPRSETLTGQKSLRAEYTFTK